MINNNKFGLLTISKDGGFKFLPKRWIK